MGKNTVEAKQWLDKRYEDSAPGKSTIIGWYAEFKRSGRPKSTVVPENITKVHKIVLGDCKLTLREIDDTLKIAEGSVFTILHESLGMRKFFSKWVCGNGWNIDPPLHTWNKKIVSCVDSSWWKPSKANKNSTVVWQGYGIRILGRAWYFVYRGITINSDYYMALLDRLSAEIKKKWPHMQKKKVLFHQDNAPCYKSWKPCRLDIRRPISIYPFLKWSSAK